MPVTTKEPKTSLKRLEKRPRPTFWTILLPLLAVLSSVLLTLALPGLIGAEGPFDLLKCLIIGVSAGVTAYAVNRYALERGAIQAAIGSWVGGIISLASILAVGTGLAMATYAGLVIEETDRLRLQQFSTEHSDALQDRMSVSQEAARLAPIMSAIVADLERSVACEAESSCVSGRGNGGRGTAYRKLLGALGRAQTVAAELYAAQSGHAQVSLDIAGLQDELRALLSDASLSGAARRLQTEQLTQLIESNTGTLRGASPVALVEGFAQELLAQGAAQPEDRLLASYGAQLSSALEPRSVSTALPPAFPAPTGVADTLRFIGYFLPIALLVLVIELILPATLWTYGVIDLRTRLEEQERKAATPPAPKRRRAPSTPKS